jgi:superfamily II DNA helicase RecQ
MYMLKAHVGPTLGKLGVCHAGLSAQERERVGLEFADGRINILCATSAMEMVTPACMHEMHRVVC